MFFSDIGVYFLGCCALCWLARKEKQTNYKKKQNNVKIVFCWRGHQRMRKKKMVLCKHCKTLFVFGQEKKGHFCAHYLCWPKNVIFNGLARPRKHYKFCGFRRNQAKPKMTPFFWKVVFWDGWKSDCYLSFFFFQTWSSGVCWNEKSVWKRVVALDMAKGWALFRCFATYLVCGGWLCDVCLFWCPPKNRSFLSCKATKSLENKGKSQETEKTHRTEREKKTI